MQQILVLNGSETPEGDTKIAAAAARALSEQADVQVLSVAGPAVAAFDAPGLRVTVAPSPSKAAAVAWMGAKTLSVALRNPSLCLYTYDRTFAADIALNVAAVVGRRCIFHVNMPFVVKKSRRYALAQRLAEIWHVSEFTKAESERRGLRGGRVIANCFTDPLPDITREKATELSGIERHPSAVLVGRLSPFKGQETFIRAFRVLKDRGVDLNGYIVGYDTGEGHLDQPPHPDYRGYLEDLINELDVADRVELLGRRPGLAAFRAADIACALSDDEPFGLVVGEAAMVGRPVVATRAGAFPELLVDGTTGLLVDRRDPVATADALSRLAGDAEIRDHLAVQAREALHHRLSFDRFRDDVLAALATRAA